VLIYLAHPFGGKQENIEKSKEIQRKIILEHGVSVINPLANMGFLYGKITEEKAKEINTEILLVCDELWLCEGWENSDGCRYEKLYAQVNGIPIKEI